MTQQTSSRTSAFPVGIANGRQVDWHPDRHPNLLVTGPHGAGKTSIVSAVAAFATADGWQVIDVTDGPGTPCDVLHAIASDIHDRYERMSAADVYRSDDLPDAGRVLVVADGVDLLLAWEPDIEVSLALITNLGLSAGVSLLATCEETAPLPAGIDTNIETRIVLDGPDAPGRGQIAAGTEPHAQYQALPLP